jgi:cobalt-zinc-cadmium efflux system protein
MAGAHDDESHKHDHDGHDHAGHDHDHHGHEHSHHQHGQSADLRALIVALVLTLLITGVELVGAALYQSLALTADGWHMFSDAGSLALAVFATMIARRPRSARKTFGYHRLEVLAALANGVLLAAASVLIVHEAWVRWWSPSDVKGWQVAIVGAVSLIVNLLSAYLLHRRGHDNMNVRAALAHILGDVLGSCAAIAAGLVVQLTGERRADPLLSIVVSVLLLWSSWRIISETAHILMEGTPEGFDARKIEVAIARVPGVGSVHDLHVWSIAAGQPAVTAHVVLAEGAYHGEQVARAVCELLERQFQIQHATIQPEPRPPAIVQLGTKPPRDVDLPARR